METAALSAGCCNDAMTDRKKLHERALELLRGPDMNAEQHGPDDSDAGGGEAFHAPVETKRPCMATVMCTHALIAVIVFFVMLTLAMALGMLLGGRSGFWAAANAWPWFLVVAIIAGVVAAACGRATSRARH